MEALAWTDIVRRWQGDWLERLGYGPVETPWRARAERDGMRLRDYGGPPEGPCLLIVPAPIKRSYIWDLQPDRSAVRRLLDAGWRVFLLEWLPTAASLDLGDCADRLIGIALDAVAAETGRTAAVLAGHSLGGTFAAIFAALHPDRSEALLLIEAPMRFGPGTGALSDWIASTPEGAEGFGRDPAAPIPGSLLDIASMRAAPETFITGPWLDAVESAADPDALTTHLRVRRWTLDEFPLSPRLFRDVTEGLYRDDRFFRSTLDVAGRRVGPEDVRAPILAVVEPRSRIVPPTSVLPFLRRTRSHTRHVLRYGGDTGVTLRHVGPLVGRSAHRDLWPRIVAHLARLA